MQRRLTLLISIATASVTFIIALLVFWLVSLYTEQKQRFQTDVRNALIESVVISKMNVSVPNRNDVYNQRLTQKMVQTMLKEGKEKLVSKGKDLVSSIASIAKNDTIIMGEDTIVMMKSPYNQPSVKADTAKMYITLNQMMNDTQLIDLKKYKGLVDMALAKRRLDIPFELGMIGIDGSIKSSTVDSSVFRNMEHVIAGKEDMNLPLNNEGTMLAAGFTGTTWYFLSKMAWLLILSAILIPLFATSYIFVLTTFFRQKKMSEIRNDFINNMTHELKTPISAASVALELIGESNIAPETKQEYTTIAQNELKRLTVLVEKVLNMAAFEKNEITIAAEKIVMVSLLQDVVTSFKPLLERNNATVSIDVIPPSMIVWADDVHFRNVVHNLLDNALKYNDKKTPLIEIKVIENTDSITLSVTDNGKGIPSSYRDKVFDKFFRVPSGDVHDVKGYGLGLSYVQAVIALHKGTISVDSEMGSGSTFTITLPKTQA